MNARRCSVLLTMVVSIFAVAGCSLLSQPTKTETVTAAPKPTTSPSTASAQPNDLPAGWENLSTRKIGEVADLDMQNYAASYYEMDDATGDKFLAFRPQSDKFGDDDFDGLPSEQVIRIPIDASEDILWTFAASAGVVYGVQSFDAGREDFFELRWWPGPTESAKPRTLLKATKEDPGPRAAVMWADKLIFQRFHDGKHCLSTIQFGLETPPIRTLDDLVCAKTELWWPYADADGTVSYLSGNGSGIDDCPTLHRILLGTHRPETIDIPGCVGRARANSSLVAWSEMPIPDSHDTINWFDVPIRVMTADGTITDLGRGDGGSELPCGSGVLWMAGQGGIGPLPAQIGQWDPVKGSDPLYVSPQIPDTSDGSARNQYLFGGPFCFEGRPSFMRDDVDADIEEYVVTPVME